MDINSIKLMLSPVSWLSFFLAASNLLISASINLKFFPYMYNI